jgi:hypothetical protein
MINDLVANKYEFIRTFTRDGHYTKNIVEILG